MNIDKDIEILKEKIKALNLHILNYKKLECETSFYQTLVKERNALVNVLKELEKKDKRLNRQFKLLEKKEKEIKELKEDNKHQWEERCKLTFHFQNKQNEIDDLKEKVETYKNACLTLSEECNKKSVELETYKKIADEIEKMFGEECTKLGSYEKDNSTPEKERTAGEINILNKLRKRLDLARKEVENGK